MLKLFKAIFSRRALFVIQTIVSIILLWLMFTSKIIPMKYLIIVTLLLILFPILLYRLEKGRRTFHGRKETATSLLAKVLQVLLCVVLILGSYYIAITNGFISNVANKTESYINYSVVVLKSDTASSINDLKDYQFSYLKQSTQTEETRLNQIITKVENDLNTTLEPTIQDNYSSLLDTLYTGEKQAIVIKEADRDNYVKVKKKFSSETKVIKQYNIKISTGKAKSARVTKEPFTILIQGMDSYGKINETSRGDVEMVATINPNTKQILLTSIPRDYYVDVYETSNAQTIGKDKLTHTGSLGIECTQATVEKLLSEDINYYVKLNFSTFLKVIDAIGGIDIYNPYGVFTTRIGFYKIKEGWNHFDSKHALAYVRERHSFADGDRIRMKNQQLMIKAIMKKLTSASGLASINRVFTAVANSVETNMSSDDIKSLMNYEIDGAYTWDIQSYRLDGENARKTSFATTTSPNPRGLFVFVPNQNSVNLARQYIDTIKANEVLKIKEKEEKTVANPTANDIYRK